jgi:hypothetical protein
MSNTNTTITAGQVAPAVVNLSYSSAILVDASAGNDYRVTLTGNATISSPSNGVDGQRITIQIAQDGTGSRKVTWGSGYLFGAAGAPTLSTGANLVDVIGFVYNVAAGGWLGVGAALGF